MHSTATADSRPHDQLVVNVDNSPGAAIAARMDRLPITRHLWMLVLLISLGGFFEVYDLIFTGYIAPGMTNSGVLQTTTHAFFGFTGIAGFIAATFAGLFVGTFGLGWLPDRYGRRSVFTVSLLWYSVGSVIMAFQTTPEGMIFWRFITGIGVGVEIITIDSYVTEVVPQHMRGRAMAFNQSVMFAAAPVAAILSYWLVPTTVFGIEGWRIVVLAGAAGALLVWFIRRGVPESPRWLAIRGKLDESDAIVRNIEAIVERQSGRSLPPPSQVVVQPKHRRASLAELWQQPYRSRMVILIVFNFCQAIGYYGFASWVPTLLISQGITVTKSLLYSFIIAFALPIGPLLAMAVADRIQRKYLIVGGALIVIVCGMAFAHARTMAPLIILGVLISFAGQIISVCYHAYQAELFPTAIRGRANGIVYSASRVGAMMSGFLIAFLLRDFGVPGVFAGITACMLMVAVSIGLFGPKTNGVRLEELNH
ncbi:MFS transporter [Burkholderia sp. Bp8991]|uniref:MFS transporter n=1 Tax=Burkholderia sp. Bp8991 TaxID=2184553 RepID=UPI000F58F833|nr:MFS transporter [Burkholderia sp. Bp8991]RQS05076.1 MFS transporter [Burkholderia sp. Bp8991]